MIRTRVPEIMDSPSLDPERHHHALRSLNRLNTVLRSDHALLRRIGRLTVEPPGSVVDIGCGGASLLGLMSRAWSRRRPRLLGLDASRTALHSARQRCVGGQWLRADARRLPLAGRSIDVLTCSLFLHHFDEADIVHIFTEARRVTRVGVVISDLSRSRLALILTWWTTRLLTTSAVVHVDGPRSVRAAYRREEIAELARQAGLRGAEVRRTFPFRLVLLWRQSEASHAAD